MPGPVRSGPVITSPMRADTEVQRGQRGPGVTHPAGGSQDLNSRLGFSALSASWGVPAPPATLRLTCAKTGPSLFPTLISCQPGHEGLNPEWSSPNLGPLVGGKEWVKATACATEATALLLGQGREDGRPQGDIGTGCSFSSFGVSCTPKTVSATSPTKRSRAVTSIEGNRPIV